MKWTRMRICVLEFSLIGLFDAWEIKTLFFIVCTFPLFSLLNLFRLNQKTSHVAIWKYISEISLFKRFEAV